MKSKLSRILKDLLAQRESIYSRRSANQSTPLDLIRLAKETLPDATPLKPEERVSINKCFWSHYQMSPFDVKRKKGHVGFLALQKIRAIQKEHPSHEESFHDERT
jgi:hypothetical protein